MDTLYRHWLILRMLPRYPQKIDGATIEARLRDEGFATTTRRTIQRDLEKLSEMFPIGSDEQSKPFGWFWTRETPSFAMPGMDPATALTFHLAGHFLAPLFPPSTMNTLQPYLAAARQDLDKLEVLFDPEAGAHLRETPLSSDQTITERQDERLLIKATVADTAQLRWWLLGLGGHVEVVGPKGLRDEFTEIAQGRNGIYQKASKRSV